MVSDVEIGYNNRRKEGESVLNRIPLGITNYVDLRMNEYYVVDKTMLIKEFLDRGSKVTLITRPRRFGKTLNLSMMTEFFSILKDSAPLFDQTAIMESEYAEEMNQWPVIFLIFANVRGPYEFMVDQLFEAIAGAYRMYDAILDQAEYDQGLKASIKDVSVQLQKKQDPVKIASSLRLLSEALHQIYGKQVLLFVDDYDIPLVEGKINGCYEGIYDIFAVIMRLALKDNEHLRYALLCGVQKIASDTLFADLNHVDTYMVKDNAYAQAFGFNEAEIRAVLENYRMDDTQNVKDMYEGYRIGDEQVANPWSIMCYVKDQHSTSWLEHNPSNMLELAMQQGDVAFYTEYEQLVKHRTVDVQATLDQSFFEQAQPLSLWGLFVNMGYLSVDEVIDQDAKMYRLSIPNQEVARGFQSLTASFLSISEPLLDRLFHYLKTQRWEEFLTTYRTLLNQFPADLALQDERSYDVMRLGMCTWMSNDYEIHSSRDHGGRTDFILKAKKADQVSYVMEFKYTSESNSLLQLANGIISQIKDKEFDCELTGEIIYLGLSHCGREVAMKWDQEKKTISAHDEKVELEEEES